MKKDKEVDNSRRDLLKGLSTAAVVGVVASGTVQAATASENVVSNNDDVKKRVTNETQHIRDYYDTL
ncbi:twin-arginine translocation signal domain-containing protein [Vibrio sp. SA48]